jgi:hypothetical protein
LPAAASAFALVVILIGEEALHVEPEDKVAHHVNGHRYQDAVVAAQEAAAARCHCFWNAFLMMMTTMERPGYVSIYIY